MLLTDLQPGRAGIVEHVGGRGTFRRRLLELGLVEGTPVIRSGAASSGDLVAFSVRGVVLCVRRDEAAEIRLVDASAGTGELAAK